MFLRTADGLPHEHHGQEQKTGDDPNDDDDAARHALVEEAPVDDGMPDGQKAVHAHGQDGEDARTGRHACETSDDQRAADSSRWRFAAFPNIRTALGRAA